MFDLQQKHCRTLIEILKQHGIDFDGYYTTYTQ